MLIRFVGEEEGQEEGEVLCFRFQSSYANPWPTSSGYSNDHFVFRAADVDFSSGTAESGTESRGGI
jgi:hypothetical protein